MTRARRSTPLTAVATAVVLLALGGYVAWSERGAPDEAPTRAPAAAPPSAAATEPRATLPGPPAPAALPGEDARAAPGSRGSGPVVRNQQIHDESGRLVFEGDVDLGPVFARLAAGRRDRHRNDGAVFANREGRLPPAPRGYYTEWVVRTDGLRGVGPQRLVTGQQGEAFYTPDHYRTFIPVRAPS